MAAEVGGGRDRPGVDRRLGRAVARRVRVGEKGRDRGGHRDPPAHAVGPGRLGEHDADRGQHGVHHAVHVDREGATDLLGRLDPGGRRAVGHSGVGKDEIERAVPLDQLPHSRFVDHVADRRDHSGAALAAGRGDPRDACFVAAGEHQGGLGARERVGERFADPARGTGDEDPVMLHGSDH